MPLARVVGVHLGLLDRKESPESFAKRLKTRGSEDLLLAQTKNGEVVAIPGIVEGTDGDKLRSATRTGPGRCRSSRSKAWSWPRGRNPTRPDELRPGFTLPGGVVVSGRWKDLDTSVWKVETAWGQELKLPAAEVQSVRFRGGQDDVPLRPQPEQGRGDPVLRPPAPLAHATSTCWASR